MARVAIIPYSKKGHADPYHDAMAYEAGDVIEVLPDGHVFSAAELATFVIVDVPGVSADALSALVAPDVGDPAQHIIPQRRAHSFDLAKWHANGKKPIGSLAAALAHRKVKPRVSDPNVLGQSNSVL